jgi:hypothetical protein
MMEKDMPVKKTQNENILVEALKQGEMTLRIIGTTPLFQNRMSEKARQQLFVGSRKKTAAEKAAIKHDPWAEFISSAERVSGGPTALGLRVVAIKAAMCQAAVETAGVSKAGCQRLLFMPGDHVPLYGIPRLRIDVVRSADMNRTPDIRTRAFLNQWGAEVPIKFIAPQLSATSVTTLLHNAGKLIGVGDFRQEKGKGAFGSFRVISPKSKDAEWDDLVKNQGRKAQEMALNHPEPANEETRELLDFWSEEAARRAA